MKYPFLSEVFAIHILLDIVLLAVIILPIALSARRGFVKSISKTASLILAVVISVIATPYAVKHIDNTKLTETLENRFKTSAVSDGADENAEIGSDQSESKLSAYFSKFGIDIKDAKDSADEKAEENDNVSHIVASYIADKIIYYGCKIAIFVASYIILLIIFALISKIAKLPVLKHFDRLLGGVTGIITSCILTVIFISAFKSISPYLCSAYPKLFDENIIDNTLLFRYVENYIENMKGLL